MKLALLETPKTGFLATRPNDVGGIRSDNSRVFLHVEKNRGGGYYYRKEYVSIGEHMLSFKSSNKKSTLKGN